ncbi:tail sheath stabilizer and completion protein [uncultured Caudovirales phage]|uniref:Tail sheath stabilizer and completion protein n=1 Tax=uncultured Caudovirales phage TaxID=2100421 RepID=A0A6J7WT71_9CAUD|nr:tail sheath stabilizer and completion protein [uncultured Caudovirales phage]
MLSSPFYNSLFKKYVVIFGTIFNNIKIERKNTAGGLEQTFKIPIAYGPREKFLARIEDNPDATALTAIKLPRMAFEMTDISYAPNRKINTTNKLVSKKNLNGKNVYDKVFTPAPYDIGFRLDIMTKTMEDGLRIVEQILPYFTPEWTVSAKLLSDFDNVTDIPIVLNNVSIEDSYASDFTTRRVLTFTLNFTMKCYFFGPITESRLIKIVDVHLYPDTTANNGVISTTIRPGLTSDGLPTSNADLSVVLSQIDETDQYGFIITTTESYGG